MPNYKINLTEQEEKGIRKYLAEDQDSPITNMDIANYLQNIITATINSEREAVSDYIKQQA